MEKLNVYISGRISGLEYSTVERLFGDAECEIIKMGHTPINPLNNGLAKTESWANHMVADIRMLFSCDAIMMLPNWRSSRGARIEKNIADELGLKTFHAKISEKDIVDVISAVEQATGVSLEKIKSPTKARDVYFARLILATLCIKRHGLHPTEVSNVIGKTRTLVVNYPERYESEITHNKYFRLLVAKSELELNNIKSTI